MHASPSAPGAAPAPRRGSALIIVLGILSVMMLLAVAFSTFMRVERGATTNLKNAQVAEQSLQTALGLAIQAIEDSFDDVENAGGSVAPSVPVAVWPEPWIASVAPDKRPFSTATDLQDSLPFYQSKRRGASENAASVLHASAAEHLSSNQIAMVRAAKVGWAPIYSGISYRRSVEDTAASSDGRYGAYEGDFGDRAGYLKNDSIVGRYAFVALDTTGYLDLGKVGGPYGSDRDWEKDRLTNANPRAFLPAAGAKVYDADDNDVESPFASASALADLRKAKQSLGTFFSFFDVKRASKAAGLRMQPPGKATSSQNYIWPDVYGSVGVSFEALTPEGEPKVLMPTNAPTTAELRAFARRAYPAMLSVFARSRKQAQGLGANAWKKPETFDLYSGSPSEFPLSKAALATVSLLDAIDDDEEEYDDIPGGVSTKKATTDNWWAFLKEWISSSSAPDPFARVGNEAIQEDDASKWPLSGSSSRLNFPCTEASVPMVRSVWAYVTFDSCDDRPWSSENMVGGDPYTGYLRVWKGKLHFGALARDANWSQESFEHDAMVEVSCQPLTMTRVKENTVSGEDKENGDFVANSLVVKYNYNNHTIVSPESFQGNPLIWWDGLFDREDGNQGVVSTAKSPKSSFVDDFGVNNRTVSASGEIPFTVTCRLRPDKKDPAAEFDFAQKTWTTPPDKGWLDNDANWCPRTAYEFRKETEDGPDADVWLPVRMTVKVYGTDGKSVVQQIPAPVLNENDFGLRVDAGLYHGGNSQWERTSTSRESASETEPAGAVGWAYCLAPPFAMDTTSLRTGGEPLGEELYMDEGNEIRFWVNNVVARGGFSLNGGSPANGGGGGAGDLFELLRENHRKGNAALAAVGARKEGFQDNQNEIVDWLFHQKKYTEDGDFDFYPAWEKWLAGGGAAPCYADMMHLDGPIDDSHDPFITDGGSGYVSEAYYTYVPVYGLRKISEIGRLLCGPFETPSLFKTWRLNPAKNHQDSDFHPVFDYFTLLPDRYPRRADVSKDDDDLGSLWAGLGEKNPKGLFSRAQTGRVNLNPPRLLEPEDLGNRTIRVRTTDQFNPWPIASALNGAPCFLRGSAPQGVDEQTAADMASAYCKMLKNAGSDQIVWNRNPVFTEAADGKPGTNTIKRAVTTGVSFFASGLNGTGNEVLSALRKGFRQKDLDCDASRESFLDVLSDSFTTRGQSFLLVLRADAYTSRFGMEDDPSEGTTLASTHALVELVRDPEPARLPDGTFPKDGNGDPVLFHNWFIRSFRMF